MESLFPDASIAFVAFRAGSTSQSSTARYAGLQTVPMLQSTSRAPSISSTSATTLAAFLMTRGLIRSSRRGRLLRAMGSVDVTDAPSIYDLIRRPRTADEKAEEEEDKQTKKVGAGKVKFFNASKGYGFIAAGTPEEEYRFDVGGLPRGYLQAHDNNVAVGSEVTFEMGYSKLHKQRLARNLRFVVPKTLFQLGLNDDVVEGAANALGFDPRENPEAAYLISPAPVQVESIPKILNGQDLVIAAETGSGKTLAYMLPLVQLVQEMEKARSMDYGTAFRSSSPLALILCPTRELAIQAARTLKLICHHARLRVRLTYGGSGTWVSQRREISQVVDVLVSTPDRLMKFHDSKDIRFNDIAYIAIDEADFMLTQGFEDVQKILELISEESRHKNQLRYTLVTASITKPLWKIFQEDPRWRNLRVLESRALHRPQTNCSHSFIETKGRDKMTMLIQLLQPELANRVQSKQTLVFCNNLTCCKSVGTQLKEAFEREGSSEAVGILHKELPSNERTDVVRKFARGELKVVVCTDIAQRGLDLPNCGHVVCFDFPLNSIDYLHRAGRTARYGEPGKVTSFVRKGDKYLAKALERSVQLGKPINDLSSDKRDYLRGGALSEILARHPRASRQERGQAPKAPYVGSLR